MKMVGCSGKVRHETRASADEHLESLRVEQGRGHRSQTLGIYACDVCRGFHIGHNKFAVPPRRRGRYALHKTRN